MKKKREKIKLEDILPKHTLDDVIEPRDCGGCEECEAKMEEAEAEIDRHLDLLQEYIGRELVGIERRAVFDIVDENSTKDEEGNIMLFFSFIQAWKMYEIKCKSKKPMPHSR